MHVFARTFRGHHRGGLVVPEIARRMDVHGAAGPLDDDDPIDTAGLGDRGVDIVLQRHLLAAAQTLVGGDDNPGLAIGDALGEAVRGKSGEHHGINRADPRAGQPVSGLRNHRKIDGDAIAFLAVRVRRMLANLQTSSCNWR